MVRFNTRQFLYNCFIQMLWPHVYTLATTGSFTVLYLDRSFVGTVHVLQSLKET